MRPHRTPTRTPQALLRASALIFLSATALSASLLHAAEPRRERIMVPMRDGVKLATDVYFPVGDAAGKDGPWPLVLSRTPYNMSGANYARAGKRFTEAGYVYAVQDQRGRFASEGEYVPHENEMNDGYDTVEWLAVRDWCTGKVGMTGASALGIAANLAAAADPPHLEAAWVIVAPQSLFYEGRFIGGIFKEADTGNWMRGQGVGEDAIRAYKKRVILDDRWKATDFIFVRHDIDIPICNVGGWYDLFVHGSVSDFQYFQQWGRDGARGNQKLIMGPFGHGAVRGDLEYPDGGSLGGDNPDEIRWFDHWLKGEDNGVMEEPAVRYYMMASARKGAASEKNAWRTADTWPPDGTSRTRFYLHPDFGLAEAPVAKRNSSTSWKFDPADPVKTVGGLNLTLPLGPMDQREIGDRPDYLRFSTPPLERDLVIAGKIDADLFVSTDAPDTDFIVKLVDVYPDGYEALVLDTGLRARYRSGRRERDVKMMEAGRIERIEIDMWHTAITIEAGHRLAVHVTSSNHPRYEVNPNTGEAPGESKLPPRVARNTIHHDRDHPSAIVLTTFGGRGDRE